MKYFSSVFLAAALSVCFALPASAVDFSATQFISDDEIDVSDGTLSDWPADSLVVDESSVSDVPYNTWCWVAGSETWDATVNSADDCENSFFYNGDASMDIQKGYFGVNTTNLLMGIEAAFGMQAVLNTTTGEYVDFYNLAENQSEFGVTSLPEDYSHKMVFAFGDADDEENFNYYIVANLYFPEDLDTNDLEDVTLNVYQESGDTAGWQEEEDTVVGSLDPENSETTGGNDCDPEAEEECEPPQISNIFEVKLNAEDFFTHSGMDFSQYGFRFETHSFTDASDRVVVDLSVASDPSDGDAYDTTVSSYTRKRGGKVTINYADSTSSTVSVFPRAANSVKKTKVQRYPDSAMLVVLHPNGKKVALVNALNGEVLQRSKITRKKRPQRSLKLLDVRGDGTTEVVVNVKRFAAGNHGRLGVFQVDAENGEFESRSVVSYEKPAVRVKRTKNKPGLNQLWLRNKNKNVRMKFDVSSDYVLTEATE